MKNALIAVFFGAAILVSGIFTEKVRVLNTVQPINHDIIKKEAEKAILMAQISEIVSGNTIAIDSINNAER